MFTSVPAAMCCLTASMFPRIAASTIEMSGALAIKGSDVEASATGSTGFASDEGLNY